VVGSGGDQDDQLVRPEAILAEQMLGYLNLLEPRFETITKKYDISMEDASHFVFIFGDIRYLCENV
jgi:hypothetical protein